MKKSREEYSKTVKKQFLDPNKKNNNISKVLLVFFDSTALL